MKNSTFIAVSISFPHHVCKLHPVAILIVCCALVILKIAPISTTSSTFFEPSTSLSLSVYFPLSTSLGSRGNISAPIVEDCSVSIRIASRPCAVPKSKFRTSISLNAMANLIVTIDGTQHLVLDESLDYAPDSVFLDAVNHVAQLRLILRRKPLGQGLTDSSPCGRGSTDDTLESDLETFSEHSSDTRFDTRRGSLVSSKYWESIGTTVADDNVAITILQTNPPPRLAFWNEIQGFAKLVKREELNSVLARNGIILVPAVMALLYSRCICTCQRGTKYTYCFGCRDNVCECCSFDLREHCINQETANKAITSLSKPPHSENLMSRRVLAFCSESCASKIKVGCLPGACQCEAHIVGCHQDSAFGSLRKCASILLKLVACNYCLHIRDGKYDEPIAYLCFCGQPANLSIRPFCGVCNKECSVPVPTLSKFFARVDDPGYLVSKDGTIVIL